MRVAPNAAHVATCTLNQTVGDWSGNAARIRQGLDEARARGVRLVVFPEMCIPGYSLGDRLLMRGTADRSWAMLMDLLPQTHGLVACLGLPVRHQDVLYNVAAICADGQLVGLVPKENLADGDVEYENRWFNGWMRGRVDTFESPSGPIPFGTLLFRAHGLGRFGVEVCEDGWLGNRPGSVYALSGAHIVLNPSASWFTVGKQRIRRNMVEQISREDKLVYVYSSMLGCDATRLIFDGSSFIAAGGHILKEGPRFVFDSRVVLTDTIVDLAGLERRRLGKGSWRRQVDALARDSEHQMPLLVEVEGDFSTADLPDIDAPYWSAPEPLPVTDPSLQWLVEDRLIPQPPDGSDLAHLEVELALCMALREYRGKSNIPGFALALSGGRDSAMCAVLVARMFRYNHPDLSEDELQAVIHDCFSTAYLATDHSGSATRTAAQSLAKELGAHHHEADIQSAVEAYHQIGGNLIGQTLSWSEPAHDVALQNVQARIRGGLIWMLANMKGFLLLATSNKSEAAVGYTTMDGDTSGGISPIADVPKSWVSAWVKWAADFHSISSLRSVSAIPATAELRPPDRMQTDEDDLMPYAILDRLMYHFVQLGQDPKEVFLVLWPELSDQYDGDATAFGAHIRRFVRLFCRAQWKRERFAISFRVMGFDLDPKGGFRFPAVQTPFLTELDEMDAAIAKLGTI